MPHRAAPLKRSCSKPASTSLLDGLSYAAVAENRRAGCVQNRIDAGEAAGNPGQRISGVDRAQQRNDSNANFEDDLCALESQLAGMVRSLKREGLDAEAETAEQKQERRRLAERKRLHERLQRLREKQAETVSPKERASLRIEEQRACKDDDHFKDLERKIPMRHVVDRETGSADKVAAVDVVALQAKCIGLCTGSGTSSYARVKELALAGEQRHTREARAKSLARPRSSRPAARGYWRNDSCGSNRGGNRPGSAPSCGGGPAIARSNGVRLASGRPAGGPSTKLRGGFAGPHALQDHPRGAALGRGKRLASWEERRLQCLRRTQQMDYEKACRLLQENRRAGENGDSSPGSPCSAVWQRSRRASVHSKPDASGRVSRNCSVWRAACHLLCFFFTRRRCCAADIMQCCLVAVANRRKLAAFLRRMNTLPGLYRAFRTRKQKWCAAAEHIWVHCEGELLSSYFGEVAGRHADAAPLDFSLATASADAVAFHHRSEQDWRSFRVPAAYRQQMLGRWYAAQMRHIGARTSVFAEVVRCLMREAKDLLDTFQTWGVEDLSPRSFMFTPSLQRGVSSSQTALAGSLRLTDKVVLELIALAVHELKDLAPFQDHPGARCLPAVDLRIRRMLPPDSAQLRLAGVSKGAFAVDLGPRIQEATSLPIATAAAAAAGAAERRRNLPHAAKRRLREAQLAATGGSHEVAWR